MRAKGGARRTRHRPVDSRRPMWTTRRGDVGEGRACRCQGTGSEDVAVRFGGERGPPPDGPRSRGSPNNGSRDGPRQGGLAGAVIGSAPGGRAEPGSGRIRTVTTVAVVQRRRAPQALRRRVGRPRGRPGHRAGGGHAQSRSGRHGPAIRCGPPPLSARASVARRSPTGCTVVTTLRACTGAPSQHPCCGPGHRLQRGHGLLVGQGRCGREAPVSPEQVSVREAGHSTHSTPREACRRGPAYRDAGRRGHFHDT